MKPVIGIFPSYDNDKKQIFIDSVYIDEIVDSGGIPVIIPISADPKRNLEFIENLDGLILSGGVDIDPKYYGEENTGKSVDISPIMDEAESVLVRLAMETDLPILGICRGMQSLNVFCGGSLIQDIPSEHGFSVVHRLEKPEIAFHDITIEKVSPLSEAIGFGTHHINSYHHQAIKTLAPGFSAAAVSADGIIESIYCKDKRYVLGVQWHPERDYHAVPDSKKILDKFIKVCSETEKISK